MKTKRLGRGLEALIDTKDMQENVQEIPVDQLHPNPYQPRMEFAEDKMEELTQSIKEFGLIQPITIRRSNDDEEIYQIAIGERRWRAAKRAQLKTIPAMVLQIDDQRMMELAMVENLQREDLNPIEEARAYESMITSFNLTQETLSARLKKSRSSVANVLRLLNLSPSVQEYLSRGVITQGHARALLAVKDHSQQELFLKRIVKGDLSVRQTENMVRQYTSPKEREEKRVHLFMDYEKELNQYFSTPVHIHEGRRSKRIVIEFKDEEDLKTIVDKIKGS